MSKLRSVAVFCGSSEGADPVFLQEARRIGRVLAQRGIGLVYGGGHVGLMGAVADGVLDEGGSVVGVIPEALQSREDAHLDVTELIVVETMHERKAIMAERSDAFIALPGGPGTLEEITEQWTWAQLGIHQKPCGVVNVAGYYDPLVALVTNMRDQRFTHARFTDMLLIEESVEALLDRFDAYEPPVQHHLSPGQELKGELRA